MHLFAADYFTLTQQVNSVICMHWNYHSDPVDDRYAVEVCHVWALCTYRISNIRLGWITTYSLEHVVEPPFLRVNMTSSKLTSIHFNNNNNTKANTLTLAGSLTHVWFTKTFPTALPVIIPRVTQLFDFYPPTRKSVEAWLLGTDRRPTLNNAYAIADKTNTFFVQWKCLA